MKNKNSYPFQLSSSTYRCAGPNAIRTLFIQMQHSILRFMLGTTWMVLN